MDNSQKDQQPLNQPPVPEPYNNFPNPQTDTQPAPTQQSYTQPQSQFQQNPPVAPVSQVQFQPQVQQPIQPQSASQFTPPVESKRGKMVWLPIAIGAILILVTIAIVFVVGISDAGKSAKAYNASAKSYLEDVSDTISGSADSPEDIEGKIKDIEVPELASSIFGGLSGDYKNAQQTQTRVSEVVDEANADIKKYASFSDASDDILDGYKGLEQGFVQFGSAAKSSNASAIISSVGYMNTSCSDLTSSLDKLESPKSASETVKKFKDSTGSLCGAVSDIKSAIDDEDQDALVDSIELLMEEATNYGSAAENFFGLIDSMPSDIKKLSDPVQTLADTL